MRRRSDLTPRTAVIILVLLILCAVLVTVARGQERVCGPFDGDHPIAWLVCSWEDTNDRVDATQAHIAQLERRIAQLEAAQVTQAQVDAAAWAKATDRLHLFKQQSSAYEDRWFYDEIYRRFRVHVCRSGIPHNNTITC